MDAVIVVDGRTRRLPQAARRARPASRSSAAHEGIRVTPEFQRARPPRLRVHEQRRLVGAARRRQRRAHRRDDARGQEGAAAASPSSPARSSCTPAASSISRELIRLGYRRRACWRETRWRCTTSSSRCRARRSASISRRAAPVEQGHRNHMARHQHDQPRRQHPRRRSSSGVLKSGVMYECVKHGVDYVLAGSIRDDGPLPDTIMDLIEAQERYAAALASNVQLVLMLSSMLHSIGVGNMLPSWVRVVCVDINPAVVTKLSDRGSQQTVGVVTDVGLFLHRLAEALRSLSRTRSGLTASRTSDRSDHAALGRRASRSAFLARRVQRLLQARARARRAEAQADGTGLADRSTANCRRRIDDHAARRALRRRTPPTTSARGRCSQICGLVRMRLHPLAVAAAAAPSSAAPRSRGASTRRCARRCRPRSSRSAGRRRSATRMIIVVQTAPVTLSSIAGGATTQPSRIPGNRLFDRLVTKIVRSGNQRRERRALRREESVDVVFDDGEPVLLRDARRSGAGDARTSPRTSDSAAAACSRARALAWRGTRPRARPGAALRASIATPRSFRCICCATAASCPSRSAPRRGRCRPGLAVADERREQRVLRPGGQHDALG